MNENNLMSTEHMSNACGSARCKGKETMNEEEMYITKLVVMESIYKIWIKTKIINV